MTSQTIEVTNVGPSVVEVRQSGATSLAVTGNGPSNVSVASAGVQGKPGPANELSIGVISTRATGAGATAAIRGTSPNQILDLGLPTGATGAKGDKGDTGPANTLSIGTITTGAAGSSAAATITGAAPSQTLSLTIPRGNTGATGPAPNLAIGTVTTVPTGGSATASVSGTNPNYAINIGIPTGATGPQGPPNTLSIGTVATGAEGSTATVSITGTSPNQTLSFSIPRGNTGPPNTLSIGTVSTGAAGSSAAATVTGTAPNQTLSLTIPRGSTGATGPSNVLSVGTVTNLAPGSTPTVTITGTSPTQTINFGLVQGIQGEQGIQGPKGDPGAGNVTSVNGNTGPEVVITYESLGQIPTSVLPALAINDTFPVASQAAMLALTAQRGDIAVRTDINRTFILTAEPASTLANWTQLAGGSDVTSVAGRTGAVTLTSADVGLNNVLNVAQEPAVTAGTTAQYYRGDKTWATLNVAAVSGAAPLASPTFTGTVGGITKAMVGLSAVANAAQVDLTTAQTIAGVKTFSSAPVVPDASFAIAKVSGLQTALDSKSATTHNHDTLYVGLTGAQTIAGIKTFSSSPVVPDNSWTISDTAGLQDALNAKEGTLTAGTTAQYYRGDKTWRTLGDDAVLLTGIQSISGSKTFGDAAVFNGGAQAVALRPGSADHVYIAWNARTASPSTRSAYAGFGSGASTTFTVNNEIANGSISLVTNGTGVINAQTSQLQENGQRVYSPNNIPSLATLGAAPAVHNHHDLYYTESEINGMFAGRALRSTATVAQQDGWIRIAANTGSRASAEFIVYDVASSRHNWVRFSASVSFNSQPQLTVWEAKRYGAQVFTDIRVVTAGTYDGQYLEVKLANSLAGNNFVVVMLDNEWSTGWTLENPATLQADVPVAPHTVTRTVSIVEQTISHTGHLAVAGNITSSAPATFTSSGSNSAATGAIRVESGSPQITFIDTDQTGAGKHYWLHQNSGEFYILQDRTGSGQWDSPHPLTISSTGTVTMGLAAAVSGNFSVGGGTTTLSNATSNIIVWQGAGVAAPTFTTRSAGTKVVLFPALTATTVDYAIGIEGSTFWQSIPQAVNTMQYRWYAGTTSIMQLLGNGSLNVSGTITQNGTSVSLAGHNHDERYLTVANSDNRYAMLSGNQTIAGTKTFSSEIVGAATGNVLKVGDDARLVDVNVSHVMGIVSQTDTTRGGIQFGSTSGNFRIVGVGTSATATGNLGVSGNLTTTATTNSLNTQRFIFTVATAARPTGTAYVEWVGPVQPNNAIDGDTWVNTA